MTQFTNQQPGMPPSTVAYTDQVDKKKSKKGKKKKKRDDTTAGVSDANALSLTPAGEAYNDMQTPMGN